jgi:hypothetical protein
MRRVIVAMSLGATLLMITLGSVAFAAGTTGSGTDMPAYKVLAHFPCVAPWSTNSDVSRESPSIRLLSRPDGGREVTCLGDGDPRRGGER